MANMFTQEVEPILEDGRHDHEGEGSKEYWETSPLLNVDWENIFTNAPKTNVGMVPMDYHDWEWRQGVPQLGIEGDWYSYPTTGYVAPRDPKIKDDLGYSAYDKVEGVPQLGISDQLVRKTQPEYNRPEELEFDYDPNQPVPGGVYNTELNPYNPSSGFFPYEKDYSGIMSATALQGSGDPVYDIGNIKNIGNLPPSMRAQAEYENPDLFGVQATWSEGDIPTRFNVGLNVPMLEEKKGYIDSTAIHEARHYFENKFGFDTSDLSDEEMHNIIYQFQGMYYNNPIDRGRIPWSLTKREADAFMKMHQMGKKWYEDQGQGFGESKAEIADRKRKEYYYGTKEQGDLMEAGRKALGQTDYNRWVQEGRMTSPTRGDVTATPYSEETQKQEAARSGGTLNPREITKAAAREHVAKQQSERREQRTKSRAAQRRTSKAQRRSGGVPKKGTGSGGPAGRYGSPHSIDTRGLQEGGLVSMDYLTRRL